MAAAYEVTYGPRAVTTKGSTGLPLRAIMSPTLPGRRVVAVRPHMHLDASSGNAEALIAYQTSDDGVTWSVPSPLTAYVAASGWTDASTFSAITAAPYVRFLVLARNTSGTERECLRISLTLEIKFI